MRRFTSLPRALLAALATLLALITISYSAMWMYYERYQRKATLGITWEVVISSGTVRILEVLKSGAAEEAGLQPGDEIVSVNGRPLSTPNPFFDVVMPGKPGDVVRLGVLRAGARWPREYQVALHTHPERAASQPLAERIALEFVNTYPVLFLAVGLPVLFLRLEDSNAWLLELLFASFIAAGPILVFEPVLHPSLRGFVLAYKIILGGLSGPLFYYFFAVFPTSSPIDQRAPWLKRVFLAAGLVVVIPMGLWGLAVASSQPLLRFVEQIGPALSSGVVNTFEFGTTLLGFAALVWNMPRGPSIDACRKTRVIVWGTVLGVGPFLAIQAIALSQGRPYFSYPFWVWVPTVLAVFLFPISIAYAVVKHRVLEIPVLLKRSARYVLVQRGFVVLLFVIALVMISSFTRIFSQLFGSDSNFGMGASAVFGIVLVWASAPLIRRGTELIDQSFFRSSYDARMILQDLAEKARTVTTRREMAALLEHHVNKALHPKWLAGYVEAGEGMLQAECGSVPAGLETLPLSAPMLGDLERRGQPWEPVGAGDKGNGFSLLRPLEPECLVPLLGRDNHLMGMLVLGPRLSEEPYSGEDKRLLASVASQAGIGLESIRMAEQMAERMDAERRSLHEMDMARRVQARLFPQKLPVLRTLDYAGRCLQARQVGGDYYDFLELAPGRLGLVLADIAGKGFSGALLMANLQANLRSQYALALEDLPKMLESVNHLFCENTAVEDYTTLFIGDYDEATQRLRYVNCGHPSALLLQSGGTVHWLASTSTVLGMFDDWKCVLAEVGIASGDTLVLYSDGVTEAENAAGEEFGKKRILETVRRHPDKSAAALLEAIVAAVQEYSGQEQGDDLTLVVARAAARDPRGKFIGG